jgi:hypothetical protein
MMNLTEKKQWISWAVMAVVIAALAISGVTYPVPPAPEEGVEAKATERISVLCTSDDRNCVEAWNGSDIVMYTDAGSTQSFKVEGTTGDVTFGGTTPVLTIGDAGTEDAGIVFDGNAQDYHIILDDSADDLVIGKGSAAGTTQAMAIDENLVTSFGVAGTGLDFYIYSGTSGDHFFWDASEEALHIIGTAGQDALNVDDGNVDIADDVDVDGTTNLDDVDIDLSASMNIDGHMVDIGTGTGGTANGDDDLLVAGDAEVDDTLDVDGDIDLDGDGFDVDITGGFSVDGDAASNINVAGAGIDLTAESEAGSIVIKGDEAVATAISLDADDAAGTGISAYFGATGGFSLIGGSTGNVDLSFRDYADTTDDDMVHGAVRVNCSGTGTGAEECDMSLLTVTGGAAAGTQVFLDGSAGEMMLENTATGNVLLSFRDYADSADDDMAHVLMTANCTDASTGAEDCDFTIGVAEGGNAAETRLNLDADGGITVGSANNDLVTVSTDGTGDAEFAVPENSLGPDELAAMVDQVILCGDSPNNTTLYSGPVVAFLGGDYTTDYSLASGGCAALDNATEATADAPIGFANTSFKVLGMMCEVTSSGSNGQSFTMRSAEANLTPSVTCTIATGDTSCTSVTASTTDVAAGATIAVQTVTTEDLSAQDWWCKVFISYK